MKDILFVVPERNYSIITSVVFDVLWATDSPKTHDIMSLDVFLGQYGKLTPADATKKMQAEYVRICKVSGFSKSEQAAYDAVMSQIIKHAKLATEPHP